MWEIFVFSIKMMFKNKMRSFLTMLGIIIGILSLILIVVFGNSFSETFTQIADTIYKNDQVYVEIIPAENNKTVVYDEYGSAIIPEGVSIDVREVNKYLESIKGNSYISNGQPIDGIAKVSKYGESRDAIVIAAASNEISNTVYNIVEGRDFTRADEKNYASVAIISTSMVKYFFDNESPIGKEIEVSFDNSAVSVVIIGVYENPNEQPGQETMESSLTFINHSYLEKDCEEILTEKYLKRTALVITILDVTDKDEFKVELEKKLNDLLDNKNWTINLYTVSETVQSIKEMVNIIIKVVFVIASISLLIGGIGIMNVMIISVTERTKEIGVRKALGADNASVIYQFLCESFVISLSGTIIGICMGVLTAKVLSLFLAQILQELLKIPISINVNLPIWALMLSIFGSLIIGVVFGLYPAIKAVKMQVVDALRYE